MTRPSDRPPSGSPPLGSDAASPLGTAAPGDLVAGHYRVTRRLGASGRGNVYAVTRVDDGRELALKLLDAHASVLRRTRFAREARALAAIRHPNVVSVHDAGVGPEGPLYLVMDLVEGRDLAQHSERYGDVPWMIPVLAQVAAGLAAVHEQGIVHRDLKPVNIVIAPRGAEAPRAVLVDFGFARLAQADDGSDDAPGAGVGLSDADGWPSGATPLGADPLTLASAVQHTQSGVVVGTPAFLAPELQRRPSLVTPAVDVFAFGVLAHKLLTNLLPFAEPPLLIYGREGRLPDLLPLALRCPRLSDAASEALMRCLEADPGARPRAAELAAVLSERGLT